MTDSDKKPEAQAAFKKVRQEDEARKAMAEYEAQAIAIREKTERLRALRLAREAEMAGAAPPKRKPAVKRTANGAGSTTGGSATGGPAKRGKGAKRAAGTLADWLNQQDRSGRRT